SDSRRAGADRDCTERRERALPRDEAREARPPSPPSGHAAPAGGSVTEEYPKSWPDRSAENVLAAQREPEPEPAPVADPELAPAPEPAPELEALPLPEPDEELPESAPEPAQEEEAEVEPAAEHAAGDIVIPEDVTLLEGEVGPTQRLVAIVV